MPRIFIDVNQETYERLAEDAARERRTIQNQAAYMLEHPALEDITLGTITRLATSPEVQAAINRIPLMNTMIEALRTGEMKVEVLLDKDENEKETTSADQ